MYGDLRAPFAWRRRRAQLCAAAPCTFGWAGRGCPIHDPRLPVRAQFSGHETFALRAGWPKKAFDAVRRNPGAFSSDDAIARFGVGKNMVRSIRHWATATGVVEPAGRGESAPTALGAAVFADGGADPFLEDAGTPWLLHWRLCRQPAPATLFHFVFGVWTGTVIEDAALRASLVPWLERRGDRMPSPATLKRDRQALVNCYAPPARTGDLDDRLATPLAALGLVGLDAGGTPVLRRGAARAVPPWVFAHAVLDTWARRAPGRETLAFSEVVHADASPGRVFGLGEDAALDVVDRLERTGQAPFAYRDSAGVRQLFRTDAGATPAAALAHHYA